MHLSDPIIKSSTCDYDFAERRAYKLRLSTVQTLNQQLASVRCRAAIPGVVSSACASQARIQCYVLVLLGRLDPSLDVKPDETWDSRRA